MMGGSLNSPLDTTMSQIKIIKSMSVLDYIVAVDGIITPEAYKLKLTQLTVKMGFEPTYVVVFGWGLNLRRLNDVITSLSGNSFYQINTPFSALFLEFEEDAMVFYLLAD